MKKIFLLLSVVGLFSLTSCDYDDDIDNDTISEVFEINGDFLPDSETGQYSLYYPLNPELFPGDMVLVYRRNGSFDGSTIWEPIPRTLYFANGAGPDTEVDYDFNFTRYDILLYMDIAFGNLADFPELTNNQTFRIVIIPGYDNTDYSSLNLNDYNAVAKKLNIHESDIQRIAN